MGWKSFPPAHKKSLYRAVTAYALLMGACACWIWLKSDATIKDWNKRTPQAVATVKTIYGAAPGDEVVTEKPVDFASDVNLPAPSPGQGYVSVIMTDAGISEADTRRAMEDLPPEITLAFSPYGSATPDWIQKAKDANRETLILIPMEPNNYPKDDPGPQALLTRESDADNARRLEWILRQAGPATGAMNFMGSSLLADEKNMTTVLNALYKRSGIFVENPQGGASLAEEVAERTSTPFLRADVKIDASAAELEVKKQLVALENAAKQKGYAVGIAQPYPLTFSILKSWAASLESRGIKLVPLSALWKTKTRQTGIAPQPTLAPSPAPAPAPPVP